MSVAKRACLLAAALSLAPTGAALAATVTLTYQSAQVANDANFTSGVVTVPLTGATPTITLASGQYFRFAMAAAASNNSNPAAGGAWDVANKRTNPSRPSQPAQLGLSNIGLQLRTPLDIAGPAAPLTSTAPPNPRSTAQVDSAGVVNFDFTDQGDVQGGSVGLNFALGGGFASATSTTAAGVAKLTAFTSTTSLFDSLAYRANSAGATTITPSVVTGALGFWSNTSPGTTSDGTSNGTPVSAATYNGRSYSIITDTISTPSPISIVVTPEPSPLGLLGLAAAALAARWGRRRSLGSRAGR